MKTEIIILPHRPNLKKPKKKIECNGLKIQENFNKPKAPNLSITLARIIEQEPEALT
jgi:hypothetical protein